MCSIIGPAIGVAPPWQPSTTAGYTCYQCKQFVPAGAIHQCIPDGVTYTTNGSSCPKCGAFVLNHAFHCCPGYPTAPVRLVDALTSEQLDTIIRALTIHQAAFPDVLIPFRDVEDAVAWAKRARSALRERTGR